MEGSGKVTPKVKKILKMATAEAKAYNSKRLTPEHILLGILLENTSKGLEYMGFCMTNIDKLFEDVSEHININSITPIVETSKREIPPTKKTKDILDLAIAEASSLNSEVVDVEHIILALLKYDTFAKKLLNNNNLDYDKFRSSLQTQTKLNMEEYNDEYGDNTSSIPPKNKNSKTPILDSFCDDITKRAKLGVIDPVIGRDKEIKRITQILSRRKKNNPIIIGEAGVGKSTLVDGLANIIVSPDCPPTLTDKKVYSLNVTSVVAGTKYRGQFEARMKGMIEELVLNQNIIIFIDEIHTMVGAGNTSGSQDMSNIFKPALARGDIQVIGATTLDEFRENIEKDAALTRRFQQVMVKEPTLIETEDILMKVKRKYEDFHLVTYSDEAIKECVRMADRYITDRAMPDKAFDIMDECGSAIKVDMTKPEELSKLEEELTKISKEKTMVVKKQQYEKASNLKNREDEIKKEIVSVGNAWKKRCNKERPLITPDMVAEVVALWTGIPLSKISKEETEKLGEMASLLKTKVIGQDIAIEKVCNVIQRNKLGIGDANKPIGSFIFLGNTGVGKTHFTKVIAEYLFGDSDALIRFDMGEYGEKFNATKLFGAPPGYVGHESGGKLTEQVRRNPYSVVLFDEIEKAHPDIFNTMLNILDEGYVTDSLGRKINFKNTLIVMTSNVGVKELSQFGKPMGFETATTAIEDTAKVEKILNKSVKKQFSPEFLNRLDEVIVFNHLTKDDVVKMAGIELASINKRIAVKGYTLEMTKSALEFIADKGYSKEYGARPLRRVFQQLVEQRLSDEIISGNVKEGDTLKVSMTKGGNATLSFKVK